MGLEQWLRRQLATDSGAAIWAVQLAAKAEHPWAQVAESDLVMDLLY